jgi:hypothetical protein
VETVAGGDGRGLPDIGESVESAEGGALEGAGGCIHRGDAESADGRRGEY